MILSRSFRWKAIITVVAVVGFVSVYEETILDSKYAPWASMRDTAVEPAPGNRLSFGATAYCKGLTTASGVPVQTGVVAADPEVLPVGSVVQLDSLPSKYNGIYTVMDTGPAVHGKLVDVYMWSCYEALAFGRRRMHLTVLRLGWDPRSTSPGFLERVFRRSPASPGAPLLPSRPLPQLAPAS